MYLTENQLSRQKKLSCLSREYPLKGPTFHLNSHSSTPLNFAQCQRGTFVNVVIGKDWHMNGSPLNRGYAYDVDYCNPKLCSI